MKGLKYLVWLAFAAPVGMMGQEGAPRLANEAIVVKNKKVGINGDNFVVSLNLQLDDLKLKSKERLVFVPVVRNGEHCRKMRPVVVNSRVQQISYDRFAFKDYPKDALAVQRRNKEAQSVNYSAVLPFESWMHNSNVEVEEYLCQCGDSLPSNRVIIDRLRKPQVAYVRPKAEPKHRDLVGSAFIDFPVDKIVLYPEYRKNPLELQKIINTINVVKEDPNATITEVEIHGFASPEAPYEHNAYLAENRAKTLKDYVRNLVKLDDHIFKVAFTPEDWAGLRKYVAGGQGDLKNRQAILDIVDDERLTPDQKNNKIRFTYKEDYRFLLSTLYPALRHSDYKVSYTIRPFTLEESKEMILIKPQSLSSEEIFQVAQSYEPGSERFNEVIQIAVRLYPTDQIANLNAACAEIEAGNWEGAEKYLKKAGSSPEVDNALGVIAYRRGDLATARAYYQKAAKAGLRIAQENLNNLEADFE